MAIGKKTGGRVKGSINKATASIRDAARDYTQDALATLVEVMNDNQQPAPARVSAANAILDRGYGKPHQSVDVDATLQGEIIARVVFKGLND
jgi:hypothetical protein